MGSTYEDGGMANRENLAFGSDLVVSAVEGAVYHCVDESENTRCHSEHSTSTPSEVDG